MRKLFSWVAAGLLCATVIFSYSCEDDISNVGSDLMGSQATAHIFDVDLIAYNTNNDSIRSDSKVLQSGTFGVYEEPVFGRTKATFYTQTRLDELNPNFGEEAEMDSVVLFVPIYHKQGAEDVTVDTTYLYLDPDEEPSDSATVRLKRNYRVDSLYGNTDLPITLQVREVSRYLYSQDSIYYSNPDLAPCENCDNINDIPVNPTLLGSLEVGKTLTTTQVKKLNDKGGEIPIIAHRIKLDPQFFSEKFIDNQGSSDLSSQAAFIRNVIRGFQFSVPEQQGFLMNFDASGNAFMLVMYYSYKNPKEDDGSGDYEPRLKGNKSLSFDSYWSPIRGYNVQINQFEHSHRSSAFVNAYTQPNTTEGDARLYLDGMDGTKAVVKLNQEKLMEIRNKVNTEHWAIVGAELVFHIDDSYDLKIPPYLFAWNRYMEDEKWKETNFPDVWKFTNLYPLFVQFNPRYEYENNPKTYTLKITDYIKEIVERDMEFEEGEVVVSLGNFLLSPGSSYTQIDNRTSPFANNRAYNPYRIVLHGNNTEQADKKLKLRVYYTQKQ